MKTSSASGYAARAIPGVWRLLRNLTLSGVLALAAPAVPAAWAQESGELERLREQVDALTERVNALALGQGDGAGGARIGGYAEMHYNAPDDGTDQMDFHRFVLLISKPINEWIFFNSEVELEHAFVEGGEESAP